MSKSVVFEMALADKETLVQALKDAGYEVYKEDRISYRRAVEGAEFFASGPGCPEVGFVRGEDGSYRIIGDVGPDSCTRMSQAHFQKASGQIAQRYGVAHCMSQAKKLGYRVRAVEAQPDGSMRVRAVAY